jgi:hypothetical protein
MNTTYQNYNSKSIKKGKDTRAHRSLRLLLELERRLDSTPDKASPALLLLNRNLYKWRTTSIVWSVAFHRQGVFIGVPLGPHVSGLCTLPRVRCIPGVTLILVEFLISL